MTVPVQVPQGQMVQPYVNESGTLTHVVLSPQQYQQLHAGQGHIHPSFVSRMKETKKNKQNKTMQKQYTFTCWPSLTLSRWFSLYLTLL